ncbi:MAG: RDD family protein, partial [Chloroflexota bacterium]
AGGTPGKLLLGFHIVGADGRHIGFGRSFARFICQILSAVVLCLGYIWVGVDAHKQGWHDKIAGTFVIRKEFVKP